MSQPRYRRHDELRITALDGEGVVLHLRERRYFSVNGTGLTILEAAREPQTFEELVARLEAVYDVTAQEASTTARAFLNECLAANVIVEERT